MQVRGQQQDQAKAEEKARRDAEQKAWEQGRIAFLNYYMQERELAGWRRIDKKNEDQQKEEAQEKQAGLSSLATVAKLLENGIYVSKAAGKQDFSISIENGVAYPHPSSVLRSRDWSAKHPEKYMQKFESVYGEMMDLLAGGQGYQTINIHLTSSLLTTSEKDYNEFDKQRLYKFLEMIEKRGLNAEFDANTRDIILRFSPAEQEEIFDRLAEVRKSYSEKEKNLEKSVSEQGYHYDWLKNKMHGQEKVDNDPAKARDELNEHVSKDVREGMDRYTAIEKELKDISSRLDLVERGKQIVDEDISRCTLKEPLDQVNDVDFKKAKIRLEDNKQQREEMMEELEKERTDLSTRAELWKTELEAEKAKLPPVVAGAELAPDDKAKSDKIDAMLKTHKSLSECLKKLEAPAKTSIEETRKNIDAAQERLKQVEAAAANRPVAP